MSFVRILQLPLQNNGLKTILIGGLLQLIPVLNLFSAGFAVQCLVNGLDNRRELPAWKQWQYQLIYGILALVVSVIYLLIPVLGVYLFIFREPVNIIAGVVLSMLLVLVLLILPLAVAHLMVRKSFWAAFSLGQLFKLIKKLPGEYFIAWIINLTLVAVAVLPFFWVLVNMGAHPQFVPALILAYVWGALVGFYGVCAVAMAYGAAYRFATGQDNKLLNQIAVPAAWLAPPVSFLKQQPVQALISLILLVAIVNGSLFFSYLMYQQYLPGEKLAQPAQQQDLAVLASEVYHMLPELRRSINGTAGESKPNQPDPFYQISLKGVLLDGQGGNKAIIETSHTAYIVYAGMEIAGGWQVAEIKADRVLLKLEERELELKLKGAR